MASSLLASFVLLILISNAAAKDAATISSITRIPLSKPPNYALSSASSNNAWESIRVAAKSSLTRARHLKRRTQAPPIADSVKVPSYPRSFGGYSISLSIGTPPQQVSLVLDTGSSLVWTPCTTPGAAYSCQNCSFSGVDPTKLPIYALKNSSTAQRIPCRSPQCGWVFGSDLNCSTAKAPQPRCPDYQIQYGIGDTAGILVSDKLELSKEQSDTYGNFLFGCSLISDRQPEGIAGFGRGLSSLPAQLRLAKFSYCLVSHKFDDSTTSGDLVLYRSRGSTVDNTSVGVSYAPFAKSPSIPPYSDYYYIPLSTITVGGKSVQLPPGFLVASEKGDGGVIVDSGSTFTYMERPIFDPVAKELEKQMSKYKRAQDVEDQSGLGPCFDVTGQADVEIPKLALLFAGGTATMDLPLADYFILVGGPNFVCMSVLTDPEGPVDPSVPSGPAMILGNYQQQNFYVEYDLKGQRFGFKPQQCDQATH